MSNNTPSLDEDSQDYGLLMFSRLPGLSSDVINDVFRPTPATVSPSADATRSSVYQVRFVCPAKNWNILQNAFQLSLLVRDMYCYVHCSLLPTARHFELL